MVVAVLLVVLRCFSIPMIRSGKEWMETALKKALPAKLQANFATSKTWKRCEGIVLVRKTALGWRRLPVV